MISVVERKKGVHQKYTYDICLKKMCVAMICVWAHLVSTWPGAQIITPLSHFLVVSVVSLLFCFGVPVAISPPSPIGASCVSPYLPRPAFPYYLDSTVGRNKRTG